MDYSELAKIYEKLEATTSKLEKSEIISIFLKRIPRDLLNIAPLLLMGKVFPEWSPLDLGVGPSLLYDSISSVSGISKKDIEVLLREEGDIGLAVERLASEKKFKKPVEVANDADCVALSEAKYGCKKKNFFILTLGTGIGGGIIIDGKLYTGQGYGGELGHIILHDGKDLEHMWKENRIQCKSCFGKIVLMKDLLKKINDIKYPQLSRIKDDIHQFTEVFSTLEHSAVFFKKIQG